MDNNILIENNWLKKLDREIMHRQAKKNTKLFSSGSPDTIVIHYTAGKNALSSVNYLLKDTVKASAHLVIGRDSKIYQLVPFNTVAWHAGKSSYNNRVGLNNYSIGIEIDNAGPLEKSGTEYISWFGKKYNENDVIKARHRNEGKERFWHTYTEKQIELVQKICEKLMEAYPAINTIVGHEEISPGRKQDPGPAFPLNKLRNLLVDSREEIASNVEDMEGFVDVPKLNIREMPNINSELAASPLVEGTKVKIKQKYNGWYKVETKTEGWVASEYIGLDR